MLKVMMLVAAQIFLSIPLLEASDRASIPFQIRWENDEGIRMRQATSPAIYKISNRSYRLYYSTRGGIRSALSEDARSFSEEPGFRVESNPQKGNPVYVIDSPAVLSDPSGTFTLYYHGSSGTEGPGKTTRQIFLSKSEDGFNFQETSLLWDSWESGDGGWAGGAEIFNLKDGGFRIYYESAGREAGGGLVSRISRDGLQFEKEKGVRVRGFLNPAVVSVNQDWLLMAAEAPEYPPHGLKPAKPKKPGIYGFVSKDGLKFIELGPVLIEKGISDPALLFLNESTIRIFYSKEIKDEWERTNVIMSITGEIEWIQGRFQSQQEKEI